MSCWEKGVEIPNSNCGFVLFFFFFQFYRFCSRYFGTLLFSVYTFRIPVFPWWNLPLCPSLTLWLWGWAHDCSWLLCFFYAIVWGRAVGCLKTQGSDKQSIKDHGSQNRPNEGLRTSEGQSWDRPVSLVHLMFCPGQAIASVPVASGWVPLPVTNLGHIFLYFFSFFSHSFTLPFYPFLPFFPNMSGLPKEPTNIAHPLLTLSMNRLVCSKKEAFGV